MELVVHQRPQVVLAAADLLAAGGDIHADAALLDLHSPGDDEGHDEQNGQQTIEHNLDGIVAGDPGLNIDLDSVIVHGLHDLAALDRADGAAGLEPVALAQPVKTAAGNQHIADKYSFKQQKQQTTHDLTIIQIAEAEQEEGQLNCPVALGKGGNDVDKFVLDGDTTIFEEVQNGKTRVLEPKRDRAEE